MRFRSSCAAVRTRGGRLEGLLEEDGMVMGIKRGRQVDRWIWRGSVYLSRYQSAKLDAHSGVTSMAAN